ncbi:hypothetical protein CASFOL_035222 [Castilleja foliolosa]|uniref:CCHC-type domain-containing protein n=1 Tax=Castilleja foliolosa TaxID=1961234 RepID=A0ABD3BMS7_9LAMI
MASGGSNDNTNTNANNTAAVNAMNDAFATFLQNMPMNGGINNNEDTKVVGNFRSYQPPTFNGKDGPSAVEEWFRSLERIFRVIECTDAKRVTCAAFQLIEDADHWWESYWRTRTEAERNSLTWAEFKEIVMGKFYPQSYRDKKETQFLNFKQRDLTITEYEREFNQLSRFAPHLVDTDLKKAMRFKRGLRAHLAGILSAQGDLEYAEMVKRAQNVEASLAEDDGSQKAIIHNDKRKWDGGNLEGGKQMKTFGQPSAPNAKPRCMKCDKHHNGECLFGQRKCYRCKQPGHESRECPLNKEGNNRQFNSKPPINGQSNNHTFNNGRTTGGPARMFAMTREDENP